MSLPLVENNLEMAHIFCLNFPQAEKNNCDRYSDIFNKQAFIAQINLFRALHLVDF